MPKIENLGSGNLNRLYKGKHPKELKLLLRGWGGDEGSKAAMFFLETHVELD